MHKSEPDRILFHTGNKGKFLEASNLMRLKGIKLQLLSDHSPEIQVIEPQLDAFQEVAVSKLKQVVGQLGDGFDADWIMVEDAGLLIDHLDGFPGPYSSYVFSTIGPEGILKLMQGVESREARFIASIALWDGDRVHSFEGKCEGIISPKPVGVRGFGYDPIFIPNGGNGRTFSEMQEDEKSSFSHRANALNIMAETLFLPSI